MTYRENLPPELAMNLVGEEYSSTHTYTLMFDRDKTVLIISDESGSVIEERELEQNYETLPDDWVDDDNELFKSHYAETHQKGNIGHYIAVCMGLIMLVGIAMTLYILSKGGVI